MAASVSLRDEILGYAFRQYGVRPEYLWRTSPGDAVLRRSDNRKWFAVLLRVPKNRLGLSGEEETDILENNLCQECLDKVTETLDFRKWRYE